MPEHGSDELAFFELQWRLSNINPNDDPQLTPVIPVDGTAESLLVADVLELEQIIAHWRSVATMYRELSQICLEAAARHRNNCITLTRENKALKALL